MNIYCSICPFDLLGTKFYNVGEILMNCSCKEVDIICLYPISAITKCSSYLNASFCLPWCPTITSKELFKLNYIDITQITIIYTTWFWRKMKGNYITLTEKVVYIHSSEYDRLLLTFAWLNLVNIYIYVTPVIEYCLQINTTQTVFIKILFFLNQK